MLKDIVHPLYSGAHVEDLCGDNLSKMREGEINQGSYVCCKLTYESLEALKNRKLFNPLTRS